MDFKLRWVAILIASSMILMVGGIVVLANWGTIKKEYQKDILGETETVETETESIEEQESFEDGFAGSDPEKRRGDSLSAFLTDATFFDEEKTDFQKAMEADNENRLYFIITSVQQDMRIQIVNYDNNAITGIPFVVDIKDSGTYKDEDEDGMIYIGGLKAGKYVVSLEDIGDYIVPEKTTVTVKDKVEYTAIPDISVLIKTEADIIAEEEDTEEQNARDDSDATEITGLQELDGNGTLGIDVSKYNGEIDWDKVREDGIKFAIIRVGYRGSSTGAIVEDPYFEQNIDGALKAGLDVGVYFFTQAVNEVEAVEEASAVLELSSDYSISLPVYIDTEGAGGNGRADQLDVDTRTLVCEAFCKTIENAGLQAGVYASRNWYNQKLNVDDLQDYSIWLAEYRSAPQYDGYYQMWQYTSKGSIDGITGNVDLNISYIENETGE